MKKLFTGVAFLSAFALTSAQTIKFDETTIDYGTILPNSDGNKVFTFKNIGDKPLILSNVQPGCGCTTPEWSKDPILPGKEGKIKVHYNTNPGTFKKNIDVFSNDPVNGRVTLYIQGNVDANASAVTTKATPATPQVAPAKPAEPAKGKATRIMKNKKVKA